MKQACMLLIASLILAGLFWAPPAVEASGKGCTPSIGSLDVCKRDGGTFHGGPDAVSIPEPFCCAEEASSICFMKCAYPFPGSFLLTSAEGKPPESLPSGS